MTWAPIRWISSSLVMAFEEAFDLEIPDEDAEKITTVKDAVDYIEAKTPRSSSPRSGSYKERSIVTKSRRHRGRLAARSVGTGTEECWQAHPGRSERHRPHHSVRCHGVHLPDRRRGEGLRSGQLHREKRNQEDGALHSVRHRGVGLRASRPPDFKVDRQKSRSGSASTSAAASADSKSSSASIRTCWNRARGRISPFFIPATIINLASGYVSIRTGAKGPNSATATACTTSAHAIGDSFKIIQRGDADAMICGGTEAVHHADGRRRIRRHARAFHAQRRAASAHPVRGTRIAMDSWSAKAQVS